MNERKPILELITDIDYAVSVHRVNGVVEMHAVMLADPSEQHISRVIDGDGPAEDYRCACTRATTLFTGAALISPVRAWEAGPRR